MNGNNGNLWTLIILCPRRGLFDVRGAVLSIYLAELISICHASPPNSRLQVSSLYLLKTSLVRTFIW